MRSEYLKLYEMVQDIKFAMLNSVGENGELHSRPMTPLQIDHSGNIWFIASDQHHKTEEMKQNPKVNLVYISPDFETFVTVGGVARVLRDPKKTQELWNPNMQTWFPDGVEQEDLILIQIHIDKVDYWDSSKNRMIQLIGPINAPPPASSTASKINLHDAPAAGKGLHH